MERQKRHTFRSNAFKASAFDQHSVQEYSERKQMQGRKSSFSFREGSERNASTGKRDNPQPSIVDDAYQTNVMSQRVVA